MFRWLTAGESHGRALVAICEGVPAGVEISTADIASALARRRAGYGRGARMKFEQDEVEITGGPRPGRADLAGMQKYGHDDARPVLERASARETAARVALGEVARQYLSQAYGIEVLSHVVAIGPVSAPDGTLPGPSDRDRIDEDPVRCLDPGASAAMVAEIDAARKDGDTLGGVVEVVAYGLPPGLGSHVQ